MSDRSISVVIPTYNRETTLERAIRSVLSQQHPVLEVIVVDDGSTDGSVQLVQRLAEQDGRVRLILADHRGAAAARNRGVAEANGSLIAFQDSDDEWTPDFLAELFPRVGDRNDIVAFASHRVHYRDGTIDVVPAERVDDVARRLLTHSIISTQTALIPRRLLQSHPFDEHLARFQDWSLWLSMISTGGVQFVHRPVIGAEIYRLGDSISEGSTRIRSQSLRRILRTNRALFLRHPKALGRLLVRAYLRPGVTSKHTAPSRPRSESRKEPV
ncbi:glycosyltransferase [Agromyces sp. CFH 90414]|uniref:Glycosyltransferase n=1 Tax=Agromyces agglutinans TaxID=2662258 RepID=A0A6I2FCN0_9MICO|nr:glycosyltransferase family 2 protein [Agromyces agglutinans]MRG60430.1 glycosyltransferase [Agromyces agglutinans]